MATGIIGLVEALKYLDGIGVDKIIQRNAMLIDYLITRLQEMDVELPPWSEDKTHRSAFVGFSTNTSVKHLFERLKEQKILTITRRGYDHKELLRIAPHFFNTTNELDKFVEVLARLLR
jgi:selenocysteine lyase/cysteine desulfurase